MMQADYGDMSPEQEKPLDQRIDCLVDGELSDDQECRLLQTLERTPGGWKQCALAFLEARTWESELVASRGRCETGSSGDDAAGPGGGKPRVQTRSAGPMLRRTTGTLLGLVATFFLAFVLGRNMPPGGSERTAATDGGEQPVVSSKPIVPDSAVPTDSTELGTATLVVYDEEGQPAQTVEIPVSNDGLPDAWLEGPSSLPPAVARSIEERGFRVHSQQKRLVPLALDGQRRLYVPVEEYEIVPITYRFQ